MKLVLLLALVVAVTSFNIEEEIEKLEEHERIPFIRYHVNRGRELSVIPTKENKKYAQLPSPAQSEEFSIFTYNYFMTHHEITDEDTLDKLKGLVCFDDGTCIDIGDIGVHPF